MLTTFDWARKVNTPLIHVATPDEAGSTGAIRQALTSAPSVTVQWDCVEGLREFPGDEESLAVLKSDKVFGRGYNPINFVEPHGMLPALLQLPAGALVFLHNIHLFFSLAQVRQGVANLRDQFKVNKRTCVLMTPGIPLPPEFARDVFYLTESLPGEAKLKEVVLAAYQSFRDSRGRTGRALADPSLELLDRCVDALRGLTQFGAEQSCYTSFSVKGEGGIVLEELWRTKRELVQQTPGLSIYTGEESFENLGGLLGIKEFLGLTFRGRRRPRVVVHLDEIEKMIVDPNGASGDNGVGKRMLERLLTSISDNGWGGILLLGVPGAGKSAICKAAGNSYQVPTVRMDLGAAMGSLVGETEHNMTHMMEVIRAMAGEGALFVATCNGIGQMPAELLRRFPSTFFFDFPVVATRESIWEIYTRRFELDPTATRPEDGSWTGADIENCCKKAYEFGISPAMAARYVQPVYRQAGAVVETLRELAQSRAFLDADTGLEYTIPTERRELNTGRDLSLPNE